jgi:hypothetical protein
MIRSPKTAALAVLLAALAAAPARAQSVAFAEQRRVLTVERDPAGAERFLNDPSLQAVLRATDEDAYLELFRAATELRDMKVLLRGYGQEKRVIREGLAARPDCKFCQDATALVAWSDRYKAAPHDLLREALYEWDTLPAARRRGLSAQGATAASWTALSFRDRQAKLKAWAMAEYGALMKAAPKNAAELGALQERVSAVEEFLGHDESIGLSERAAKDEAAVTGLADAEKRLARTTDPRLKAALDAARNAPDLESRLSALSKLFDGLHIADPALQTAAPMAPGKGFDPATSRLVAEMLGPALLNAVRGTHAGADIAAFYAKTPMKITLESEPSGNIATYSEGVLNFGRENIEDFLKSRGRSARDLLTQPALMGDLVREIAPVFVHESTHHRQDVWAKDLHIKDSWSQYQEIEAMETEAVFILEKSAHDAAYRAYLEKAAKTSPNAREALSLARRMETQGADQFRRSIRAWHYPGLLSLEGETWERLAHGTLVTGDLRAELSRRAALPATVRAKLENGPAVAASYDTRAKFLAAVRAAGSANLRKSLAAQEKLDATVPSFYDQHRARMEKADRQAEDILKGLKPGAPPQKVHMAEVPSPVDL